MRSLWSNSPRTWRDAELHWVYDIWEMIVFVRNPIQVDDDAVTRLLASFRAFYEADRRESSHDCFSLCDRGEKIALPESRSYRFCEIGLFQRSG